MVTYRNTRTKEVVEIPDDPPSKPDTAGRNREWARLRTRLDESKRWERYTPPTEPSRAPQKRTPAKKTAASKKDVSEPAAPQEPAGDGQPQEPNES